MRAENPVFFLDYDGTLAPIAQRPEEAFPHPEAPRVLRALMERHPVYVVTGRRVRDLEPLLPLPGLPLFQSCLPGHSVRCWRSLVKGTS